jgi:hypothetical protein
VCLFFDATYFILLFFAEIIAIAQGLTGFGRRGGALQ